MTELENIKVGDKVCIIHQGGWDRRIFRLDICEVEKVTKTQITAMGRRWIKQTGREFGFSEWMNIFLQPLTDEILAKYKRDKEIIEAEEHTMDAVEILKKARGQDALKLAPLAKKIIEAEEDSE